MLLDYIPTLRWISSPFAVVLLSVTVILTAIHLFMKNTRVYKLGNRMPGPTPLPLVGNALMAVGKSKNEILERCMEMSFEYGTVARGWLGYKLIVFLGDPEDVEVILNSHVHLDKSYEYRFFKPWLGDGLLISSGEKWRSHRKLIAPAFHQNVLKTFVNVFNSNSVNVVERMRKEIGNVFDVHDYMSHVTVDILLETAMGTKRTDENSQGFEYAMAVMKMCGILHHRTHQFYYRFDPIFNLTKLKQKQDKLLSVIHGLTGKVFRTKKDQYQNLIDQGNVPSPTLAEIIANDDHNGDYELNPANQAQSKGLRDDLDEQDENDIGVKRRLAFLDLMIETSYNVDNLSDQDIKEEVDTIMFEGHDTTAAGSSFVLCLLGIYQDVQDKVYEEQKQIFGTSLRPVTFADTMEMKYLERVILETLRLYPPVPVIARQINEDVKIASGFTIPAGCTVVIGTMKIHRNYDYWENPNDFNPDNFLPENSQKRHYYSFIPFSAGPRSCVGRKYAMLKLKILLSTILRNYKAKSNLTEKDFRLQGDIILKRTDGFRLEIEPRQ